MQYNQNNLAVAKFAAKGGHHSEVCGVFFTDKKTVATDRYRLLEVSTLESEAGEHEMAGCKPFIVSAEQVKKLTTKIHNVKLEHLDEDKATFFVDNSSVTFPRISGQFPDYEQIIPKQQPKLTVKVNPRYLFELLQVMEKMSSEVVMKFYGENEPIMIETLGEGGQEARALLMPVRS